MSTRQGLQVSSETFSEPDRESSCKCYVVRALMPIESDTDS